MVIISIGKLFRVDETDSGNRLPKTKREKERKSKREIEIERERDSEQQIGIIFPIRVSF